MGISPNYFPLQTEKKTVTYLNPMQKGKVLFIRKKIDYPGLISSKNNVPQEQDNQ